jgi:lysophospholipase L1-like esterase
VVVAAVAGGCGAEDEPTNATVVAALGDSITAGNPGDPRSQYEYWAERELKPKGGQTPFRFRNCGVFGERTDEIALRLEGCAEGAEALIVQGGINDIAQGRPVGEAAGDLRSMVARGEELGLDVYIANVLPWNNGHPDADEPIAELNRKIEAIGRAEDVPVLDFHDALEDPEQPGAMPAPLTADGDHPSVEGHRLLGELVAEQLDLD